MSGEKHVLYGPRDDQPLPDVPLGHFLLQKLQEHGDKLAQVFPNSSETYTYADLLARSLSVAEELQSRGVQVGDVIAVITHAASDFGPILVGGLLVGAVIAPLSKAFDSRDLTAMLTLYQPKLIFCEVSVAAIVQKITPHLNSHPELVQFQKGTSWDQFLGREPNSDFRPAIIPDVREQEAFIMTSSGTTGLPKGVVITHHSALVQLITAVGPSTELSLGDDTTLQLTPVFWISGLYLHMLPIAAGGTLVVLPTFTPEKVLQAIEEYKVSVLFISPNLGVLLATTPSLKQGSLSGLRYLICAGAAMKSDTQIKVEAALGKKVCQWFAMTETLLVVGTNPTDDTVKKGSSGRLRPNVKAKILDIETGEPLGPMQQGELCVFGPGLTKGYYRNPEATAETIDDDGWLHTGDVAYYDEDGCFYLVDRIKDLIKYKGLHVAPVEIEAFLLEHPGVKEVAVIGIKNDLDQEHPMAVIVKTPESDVTEQELVDLVAGSMAERKWLRAGVRFVESFPKTTTGKIQKRKLREQMSQQNQGSS